VAPVRAAALGIGNSEPRGDATDPGTVFLASSNRETQEGAEQQLSNATGMGSSL